MKFKVTFTEEGTYGVHTHVRTCDVPSEKDVIDWYGLEEPDILNYTIEAL